jgi:molybdopterin converting factor small subunit
MVVEVKLFATFRENRFKEKEMELADAGSPADILTQLNIPTELVGILLVNGRNTSFDQKLVAGDVVSIFPAIGGG